jgi:hypothetical protein
MYALLERMVHSQIRTSLSYQQSQALAAGAIMAWQHEFGTERLTTGQSRKTAEAMLYQEFGCADRADVDAVCNELWGAQTAAVRIRSIYSSVALLDAEQLHVYLQSVPANRRCEYSATWRFRKGGFPSLLGWTLGRMINLCRWGVSAKWFDEDEAWERIGASSDRLLRKFDSWNALRRSYLFGCEFSGRFDILAQSHSAAKRLMTLPDSPWRTIAWRCAPNAQGAQP